MSRITATFDTDAEVQALSRALEELGIQPAAIRIVVPMSAPAEPADDADEGRDRAAAAGFAGFALAAGGGAAAQTGSGYPAYGVAGGLAAASMTNAWEGDVGKLDLDREDAALYRQRLSDGSTLLSVDAAAELEERVAALVEGHGGRDMRRL